MLGIEEAILNIFISYLVKMHEPSYNIQDSPSWYMKEISTNKLSASSYSDGDLDSLEIAKKNVENKLLTKVFTLVEMSVDEAYTSNQYIEEKNLFKKDENLKAFILTNIKFENLVYEKKKRRAFARGYIDKKILKEYQKKRIFSIRKRNIIQDVEHMKKSF